MGFSVGQGVLLFVPRGSAWQVPIYRWAQAKAFTGRPPETTCVRTFNSV